MERAAKIGAVTAALMYLLYLPTFTELARYRASHPDFPQDNYGWSGNPVGLEHALAVALAGAATAVAMPYVGRMSGLF